MSVHHEAFSTDQQVPVENTQKPHKFYHKPHLYELGDLRTLTLGSSPSTYKDSGGGAYHERVTYTPGFPQDRI
jgi:hypothetical protein